MAVSRRKSAVCLRLGAQGLGLHSPGGTFFVVCILRIILGSPYLGKLPYGTLIKSNTIIRYHHFFEVSQYPMTLICGRISYYRLSKNWDTYFVHPPNVPKKSCLRQRLLISYQGFVEPGLASF